MRLRNDNKLIKKLYVSDYFIKDFKNYKNQWAEKIFKNHNSCHLEIGSGKGNFIIKMAQNFPHINFIAVEKVPVVLSKIQNKLLLLEKPLNNLKLISCDANNLLDVFGENEISHIYLNFSDPWPKNRHYKRRLLYRDFLVIYEKILIKQGFLEFKSDNDNLFKFTLNEIKNRKWKIIKITNDLHNSFNKIDSVITEYEAKFIKLNKNINYLLLQNDK